jgi:hypothetical protein
MSIIAKVQLHRRKVERAGLRARIAELEAQREREAQVRHELGALRSSADEEGRRSPSVPTRLDDFRAGRRDGARSSDAAPYSWRK